jgi:hypothetical protein
MVKKFNLPLLYLYVGVITLPIGVGALFLFLFYKELSKIDKEVDLDRVKRERLHNMLKEGNPLITANDIVKLQRKGKSVKTIKKELKI